MWRLDKVTGNVIRHDYNQLNVHLPLKFALAVSWVPQIIILEIEFNKKVYMYKKIDSELEIKMVGPLIKSVSHSGFRS